MCANPGRWNFWQQLRLRESRVTYSTASILSAHRLIVECFLATIPPLAVFTRAYRQNVLFLLRWSQKFTDWKIFLCAVCDVRSCLQRRYIMHIPLGDLMNVRLHVTYLPEKCCLRFDCAVCAASCIACVYGCVNNVRHHVVSVCSRTGRWLVDRHCRSLTASRTCCSLGMSRGDTSTSNIAFDHSCDNVKI